MLFAIIICQKRFEFSICHDRAWTSKTATTIGDLGKREKVVGTRLPLPKFTPHSVSKVSSNTHYKELRSRNLNKNFKEQSISNSLNYAESSHNKLFRVFIKW